MYAELFKKAGYVEGRPWFPIRSDGLLRAKNMGWKLSWVLYAQRAARPTEKMVLYRGGHPGSWRNLAWTPCEHCARAYARRYISTIGWGTTQGPGDVRYIFRTEAEPDAILARILEYGNDDLQEVVLDPEFLTYENVETIDALYHDAVPPTRIEAERTDHRIKEGLRRFELPRVYSP